MQIHPLLGGVADPDIPGVLRSAWFQTGLWWFMYIEEWYICVHKPFTISGGHLFPIISHFCSLIFHHRSPTFTNIQYYICLNWHAYIVLAYSTNLPPQKYHIITYFHFGAKTCHTTCFANKFQARKAPPSFFGISHDLNLPTRWCPPVISRFMNPTKP